MIEDLSTLSRQDFVIFRFLGIDSLVFLVLNELIRQVIAREVFNQGRSLVFQTERSLLLEAKLFRIVIKKTVVHAQSLAALHSLDSLWIQIHFSRYCLHEPRKQLALEVAHDAGALVLWVWHCSLNRGSVIREFLGDAPSLTTLLLHDVVEEWLAIRTQR